MVQVADGIETNSILLIYYRLCSISFQLFRPTNSGHRVSI